MTKTTAAVLLIAISLLVNAGMSFSRTQGKADITSEARNAELAKYTGGPLAGSVAVLVGWFGGRKLVAGGAGSWDSVLKKYTSGLMKDKPARFSIDDPANGVHLELTLTGNGESDPEGRRRIGAVTDWYASGLRFDNDPVGTPKQSQCFDRPLTERQAPPKTEGGAT
jgi:hypothetical protein